MVSDHRLEMRPQPPDYATPPPKNRTNRKIIIGVVLGCGALCLILVVVAVIGGGAFVGWLMEEPENVNVYVDVPLQVSKGEQFTIQVTVEDLAGESRLLDSIDISNSYLQGIGIRSAEPPFSESYPTSFIDFQSYTFKKTIPPNGTTIVRFAATAVQAGDFAGEIDVCIDSVSNCVTFVTRTVVEGE